MIYLVDIGTWDAGRTIEVEADSPREAGRKAQGSDPWLPDVVEIREKDTGAIVYDYYNGFELYEKKEKPCPMLKSS